MSYFLRSRGPTGGKMNADRVQKPPSKRLKTLPKQKKWLKEKESMQKTISTLTMENATLFNAKFTLRNDLNNLNSKLEATIKVQERIQAEYLERISEWQGVAAQMETLRDFWRKKYRESQQAAQDDKEELQALKDMVSSQKPIKREHPQTMPHPEIRIPKVVQKVRTLQNLLETQPRKNSNKLAI
ncbi:hypothetical protein EJ04DRAFT_608807 [Polyplosphaeria fusca]|uniref:Uncharacterized protein n=1 Tax=Polyplosphaeria fusca TaxID=682080 RepID=A0A9P4QW55_9PLEO|nr:hypothetical protein EJ04DRAFT_608807 [Polyplosphaeria fusca]